MLFAKDTLKALVYRKIESEKRKSYFRGILTKRNGPIILILTK